MLVVEQFSRRALRSGRSFAGLMELFELNYLQLTSLVALPGDGKTRFVSSVGDGLDLYGEVLERHRYTTELRLTYAFSRHGQTEADPDARLRIYHDARVAEVTACNPGARIARLCGISAPVHYALERSWARNCFLCKWLEYLHGCGHSVATLQYVRDDSWPLPAVDHDGAGGRRWRLDTPQALA